MTDTDSQVQLEVKWGGAGRERHGLAAVCQKNKCKGFFHIVWPSYWFAVWLRTPLDGGKESEFSFLSESIEGGPEGASEGLETWPHASVSLWMGLCAAIWRDSCCFVAQSHLTLCDPMDCSPPGSSVHGIVRMRGAQALKKGCPSMCLL